MKRILIFVLCLSMLFCFAACGKNTDSNTQSTESINQNSNNISSGAVFNTENIKRITFYGYYGYGKGSEVPSENLSEIINWLGSFKIDKKVDDTRWGINTHVVEIEYADGTVIKEGLDLVVIDSTSYYIKGDKAPDCFEDIISKSSLN
ncbi:MAG: hypothetical protein IJN65_03150 [Clostridia bacterium]|nr:hypothetical protein [Clostridia bacterium]